MARGQFNAAGVKSSRRARGAGGQPPHTHSQVHAPFGVCRSLGKTEITAVLPGSPPLRATVKDVPFFIHTIVPDHVRPDVESVRVCLPRSETVAAAASPAEAKAPVDAPTAPRASRPSSVSSTRSARATSAHSLSRLRRSISTDTVDSGLPSPSPSPLSARSPRSPRSDIIPVRLPPTKGRAHQHQNQNEKHGHNHHHHDPVGTTQTAPSSALEYRHQEPFVPMVMYPMEMYGPVPPPMGAGYYMPPMPPPMVYYPDGALGPPPPVYYNVAYPY